MIEIWSKGLNVCGFAYAVMGFAILSMYSETVVWYFVEVSARGYV